jgi:lysophospholipid acyltransferase (LPLAT)-like uncharacterized protein
MGIGKRLKRVGENIVLFIIPVMIVLIVRAIGVTLRYSFENVTSYWRAKEEGNAIFVFWHQKFFPLLYSHRNSRMNILVSQHRDGEMIARALKLLGFTVTRGSTTRGGMTACRLMTRMIKKHDIVITPDGPKGPRYHFSPGAIAVSRFSKRPIVPVGIGARFAKYFNSWDRFMIPLPTSRISVVFGDVHLVTEEESEEAIRLRLEEELNNLNALAEDFR